MGGLFSTCASTRPYSEDRVELIKPRAEFSASVLEGSEEEKKRDMRIHIGPLDGQTTLTAEQEAGRRRFGM